MGPYGTPPPPPVAVFFLRTLHLPAGYTPDTTPSIKCTDYYLYVHVD